MINTFHRLKRQRDAGEINGFTLLEILVVIVVLGILAAVVIFALGGIAGKSAIAACQADGATVSTALATYHSQNAGTADAVATQAKMLSGTTANSNSPYLQSWPSNSPHYAFGIVGGALYIEVPFTTLWNTTPANGGTLATGMPYTAPANCTTVS
jgi:general secretion pathway protein G